MKIQYASDLHLEFPKNKQFFMANKFIPTGEVLILAGDIIPFSQLAQHNDFFDFIADNFEKTYWLPGNHEYYHFDLADKCGAFTENIRSNVVLLNNSEIHYENTQFVFSTMWSKISPENAWNIEHGMNDFRLISFKKEKFNTEIYNQLHFESINFIQEALKSKTAEKTIVVSHHVPTFLNYSEIYKDSKINEGFAVELFDFIAASPIDFWIYGHSHSNTKDFKIGKTKMLTNQLGYLQLGENSLFQRDKIFEI